METADAIGCCKDRIELLRSDGVADEDILLETESDIYAGSAVVQIFVVCLHSEIRHSYGWLSDKEEPDINKWQYCLLLKMLRFANRRYDDRCLKMRILIATDSYACLLMNGQHFILILCVDYIVRNNETNS